jgi:hypothetical protein
VSYYYYPINQYPIKIQNQLRYISEKFRESGNALNFANLKLTEFLYKLVFNVARISMAFPDFPTNSGELLCYKLLENTLGVQSPFN